MGLIERDERTCDRCAQRTDDWESIDDAYICAACRAEIAEGEAEVEALREQLRGAVSAARVWLEFDNEVEPPHPDAPYEEHLAYERKKAEITEALAAAIGGRGAVDAMELARIELDTALGIGTLDKNARLCVERARAVLGGQS